MILQVKAEAEKKEKTAKRGRSRKSEEPNETQGFEPVLADSDGGEKAGESSKTDGGQESDGTSNVIAGQGQTV